MPNAFQGKIALDIRDSVPDWAPYLSPKAPEGAPNVLMIAWDDVGYGTMDVLRWPGRDARRCAASPTWASSTPTSTPRRCVRRRGRRC